MADDDFSATVPGRPADQQQPASDVGGALRGVAAASSTIATILTTIRLGGAIGVREIVALADAFGGTAEIPVISTAVLSIKYESKSGDMEVTLKDGSVYYYPSFPMYTLVQWLNSRSKGAFYNAYIRGMHKYIMGKKKGWKMPLG